MAQDLESSKNCFLCVKENAMICSYCSWFLKDKSAFGNLTGLDGVKKQITSEAHFLVKN